MSCRGFPRILQEALLFPGRMTSARSRWGAVCTGSGYRILEAEVMDQLTYHILIIYNVILMNRNLDYTSLSGCQVDT
jgi:hypothetical protein